MTRQEAIAELRKVMHGGRLRVSENDVSDTHGPETYAAVTWTQTGSSVNDICMTANTMEEVVAKVKSELRDREQQTIIPLGETANA